MSHRHLHITVAAQVGQTRKETHLGRSWTVVPVVALVEGVIHAMNASTPELVRLQTFSQATVAWNGRPVFVSHPTDSKGNPIAGNTPETLERAQVGLIFNAGLKKDKLVMEAWLDDERAEEVQDLKDLLERVEQQDPIEISVGAYVETDDSEGEYGGKTYKGEWITIIPEHLALLKADEIGACSREMGCGVRAAKGAQDMTRGLRERLQALMGAVLGLAQSPEEMSDNDVRRKLYEAARASDPRVAYIEAVYAAKNLFVYCTYQDDYSMKYFERNFSVGEDGAVLLSGDPVQVEPTLVYNPLGEAQAPPTQVTTASGASCSCQHAPKVQKENDMTKTERVKALINKVKALTEADQAALEALSDDLLTKLEQMGVVETPATEEPETPAVAPAAAAAAPAAVAVAPAAAEPVTLEALLAAAPQEVRESFAALTKASGDRKAATIKSLKDSGRCKIADEALLAMSQGELDNLVTLAAIPTVAAVDYSGQGAPRPEGGALETVAPPSDLKAALAAKAATRK